MRLKGEEMNHLPDDLLPTGNRLLRYLEKFPNLSEEDLCRECRAFYIQMTLTGRCDYLSTGYFGLLSGWLSRANFEYDELEALKKEIENKPNKGFFEKLWR